MYFYVIQTVFKTFKNHKNQRSQIMLDFILKIYNLLSNRIDKPKLIFFHLFKNNKNQNIVLNFSVIYNYALLFIIMYFYVIQTVFKLFKNHKNQRSQIVLNFILKILQSAKSQTGLIFFHLKIALVIYNYVFLCYLDCFQTI